VTVRAISTATPRGDKRRDHLFILSVECAVHEEHGLGEPHHVARTKVDGLQSTAGYPVRVTSQSQCETSY
jgi:hypothetical protein